MKKFCILALVLALLCVLPALAEEKDPLVVTQENFHVLDGYSVYGYYYGKVENTGDKPIRIDSGELEIYDPDGNTLVTSTYLGRYAEYLQPGEYTYVYFTQKVDGVETADQVGDFKVTVTSKEASDKVSFRLPGESYYEDDVQEGYWTHDYVTTDVINDCDQTVYDISIVRALLDADGNILYMDFDSMYSYKGLTSGSSIVLRRTMSSSFLEYFEKNGIVPASVDTIVYANVDADKLYTRGGAGAAPAEAEEKVEPAVEEPAEVEPEYATLQKGSKGEDVRALQQRLKDLGYLSGTVDGDFGKGTAGAVSAFQTKAGLEATGIADDATQKALFADDAPAA